jgi:hypothetical protein
MDLNTLSDDQLDCIHRAAEPLDPADRTKFYNAVVTLMTASTEPQSFRSIVDIVQRAQKAFNRNLSCAKGY